MENIFARRARRRVEQANSPAPAKSVAVDQPILKFQVALGPSSESAGLRRATRPASETWTMPAAVSVTGAGAAALATITPAPCSAARSDPSVTWTPGSEPRRKLAGTISNARKSLSSKRVRRR